LKDASSLDLDNPNMNITLLFEVDTMRLFYLKMKNNTTAAGGKFPHH